MGPSSKSLAAVLAGCALTATGFAAEPVTPPAPLRYAWAQAGKLAYALEIEIDHGDEVETQKGTVCVSVTPGDEGQALVSTPPLRLGSQRTLKPGRNPLVPGFGPPVPRLPVLGPPGIGAFNGHELKMDARGRVISERGDAQLPFALGALLPLLFQPLPEAAEAGWQRTQETAIRVTADGPFRNPFRAETETGRLNAEEVTTCAVSAVSDTRVELTRTYVLKTVQTVDGEAAMELSGSGTIALDRGRGVPAEVTYALRFHERAENREQRYPIRFSCKLLNEADLKQQEEQAKAALGAAKAAAEARRAPPTPPERDALLTELQSSDKERARRAINTLQHKQPEKPDAAIAAAIAGWLGDADTFIRQQAAEALANWGTAAEAPALLKILEGSGFDARAAGRVLGKLKEKRAAPVLAAKLTDMSWRFEAAAALTAIGTPAEGVVAKLLKDKDWGVRLEACRILQQVGSKDSLKALDAVAASDDNPLVKQTAAAAAQAIRAR
jgi:hypothetical protein